MSHFTMLLSDIRWMYHTRDDRYSRYVSYYIQFGTAWFMESVYLHHWWYVCYMY